MSEHAGQVRRVCAMALAEARIVGEPSLLLAAISAAATTARGRAEVRALVNDADSRLSDLPDHGTYLPAWFVGLTLVDADLLYYVDPARAEASLRDSVTRAAAVDDLRDRVQLATVLLRRGATAEAAELLAPFVQEEMADNGWYWPGFEGAIQTAVLHTYLGEFDQARAALALAERRLRRVGSSGQVSVLAYRRAVFLRGVGEPDAAEAALLGILDPRTSPADALERAEASLLLAVLKRERGDEPGAVALLVDAWRVVAGWDAQHLTTILACLVEVALHLSAAQPAEAARLLALVQRERRQLVFHDVAYDVPALQSDLRERLGESAYAAVLRRADRDELPDDPEWLSTVALTERRRVTARPAADNLPHRVAG